MGAEGGPSGSVEPVGDYAGSGGRAMTSGIVSVFILILGNILVIGLEGLSAGIQALRLSYYEFFTKFFHGTGHLYTPISLSSRDK